MADLLLHGREAYSRFLSPKLRPILRSADTERAVFAGDVAHRQRIVGLAAAAGDLTYQVMVVAVYPNPRPDVRCWVDGGVTEDRIAAMQEFNRWLKGEYGGSTVA